MEGEEWPANHDGKKRVRQLTKKKLGKADIAIFFGHQEREAKWSGSSYIGTACKNTKKEYRCQLDMWQFNPSVTAGVVAHEIGHNIGMQHDFHASHQGAGCDKTGIMSSGNHLMQWSTCSRADFEAHYLMYKDQWCMEEDENACQTA